MVPCHTQLLQSCLTLCIPMDCSPPCSSVHAVFLAGTLEWVAISSSSGSSWFKAQTHIGLLCLLHCRGILYHWATRKTHTSHRRRDFPLKAGSYTAKWPFAEKMNQQARLLIRNHKHCLLIILSSRNICLLLEKNSLFYFIFLIFLNYYFLFVVDFVIHWNETAMGGIGMGNTWKHLSFYIPHQRMTIVHNHVCNMFSSWKKMDV